MTIVVAVLLLMVAGVLWYGQADGPTNATNAAALKNQVLPDDLPAIAEPGQPGVDAGPYYKKALALYTLHPDVLPKTKEHDALVAEVSDSLLKAASAGHVEPGFMDKHIPVKLGAQPDYGPAVEEIAQDVLMRSITLYTSGEHEKARDLALAVWVFGRRLFENNTRLYNRNTGLDLMESAGSQLYQMSAEADNDQAMFKAWGRALDDIRRAWQPKLELILSPNPHPGDLVNIARHDEDITFRVKATLRLGLHRYAADRGNRRAMQRAIDQAKASDDPLLAEAGRAADTVTHEQAHLFY